MGRTLLLGTPRTSWRSWIKQNLTDRDLLRIDPSDAAFGTPAIFSLVRREKMVAERFYGSLDPQRAPHLLLHTFVELLAKSNDNAIVQCFPYRSMPVMRQTLQLMLHFADFDRILVSQDFPCDRFIFKKEPERVEVEKSMPNSVQTAQRKARWLDLKSRCENHTVDLRTTLIEGIRLGSGVVVDSFQSEKLGLKNAHVEISGQTLFIITDEEVEEGLMSRAMDFTHTNRVQFATPDQYEGCLCAFSKASGEDFGFGIVTGIDFQNWRANVLCTAIPPVPVPVLKLGSIRVDYHSNELGEPKPWSI